MEQQLPPSDQVSVEGRERFRAVIAIAAAWLFISTAGATLIFTHWSAEKQRDLGATRAAIFTVVMTAVCAVGYRLYINQSHSDSTLPQTARWATYWPALKTAIIVDCVFLILGALMLDMGQALHVCTVTAIAHWVTIALIIFRRTRSPSVADLVAIRWGYLPIMILVGRIGPLIWTRLGRW